MARLDDDDKAVLQKLQDLTTRADEGAKTLKGLRAALDAAPSGYLYDAGQKALWIKIPSGATSRTLTW